MPPVLSLREPSPVANTIRISRPFIPAVAAMSVAFLLPMTPRLWGLVLLTLAASVTYGICQSQVRRLKQAGERAALAAVAGQSGVWDWDLITNAIYVSPQWHALVGMNDSELTADANYLLRRIHHEDRESVQAAIHTYLSGQVTRVEHEHRLLHQDGTYRWMLCRAAASHDSGGRAVRLVGSHTDITERATAREQLRQAALHDTLTGLPNRALFMELLSQALERSKRHPDRLFAVLFLDVDRFKGIND